MTTRAPSQLAYRLLSPAMPSISMQSNVNLPHSHHSPPNPSGLLFSVLLFTWHTLTARVSPISLTCQPTPPHGQLKKPSFYCIPCSLVLLAIPTAFSCASRRCASLQRSHQLYRRAYLITNDHPPLGSHTGLLDLPPKLSARALSRLSSVIL